MGPLPLLLAIHNHQPVGNFGHVFEQAYADCYGPLIAALDESPHVRVALHHTGALFEWLEQNRKDYFATLRKLVERKQVELLGGGFYEPMLAVLPERDAIGQIKMMSDYLVHHFGVRPRGMWLAERVWEPALAQTIAQAGMSFTLVDDGHFRAAGLGGILRGYYVTEKAGVPLALFPIDMKLRQAIPFMQAEETMQVLSSLRDEANAGVTYGDDGEKFGVWPDTKEWVWEKGWLRKFFALLGERRDTVETVHFGEYLDKHAPTDRVYLPTASYEEMGEWTLPSAAQPAYHALRHDLQQRGALEQAKPFLHGGIWQGFFAKYPESNWMHKKMIYVSNKVAAATELTLREGKGPSIDQLTRPLYQAQCNCAYWHGLFGGLYLNYLRDSLYHQLLAAEAFADARLGLPAPAWAGGVGAETGFEEIDVDADLQKEILLRSRELGVTVSPHRGGALQEIALREKCFMLSNVLGRHREGYHAKLKEAQHGTDNGAPKSIHDAVRVKEAGLERFLIEDSYPRLSFLDHFYARSTTLDDIHQGRGHELGDFVDRPYRVESRAPLTLVRDGVVAGRAVTVRKTISVEGPQLQVRYAITVQGTLAEEVWFSPEISLTLLDGHADNRFYDVGRPLDSKERQLASIGVWEGLEQVALVNLFDRFRFEISFGRPVTLFRYPLETVSMSEGGFERTYQGSVLLPLFAVQGTSDFAITLYYQDLPTGAA